MNLLPLKVMDFKGDEEYSGTEQKQVTEPTFYDDGTVEIMALLAGNRSAYLRFSIGELVRLRAETVEAEEAPEG